MRARRQFLLTCLLVLPLLGWRGVVTAAPSNAGSDSVGWLSPAELVAAPGAPRLFVACGSASRVLAVGISGGAIEHLAELPAPATGLASSPNGGRLYATCGGPVSWICEIDVESRSIVRQWSGGHTVTSPVLSADGRKLYVCERFDACVAIYDLENGLPQAHIPVGREPIAAALTKDGKFLLVAHHLPEGRADTNVVAAGVSVVDLEQEHVIRRLVLPNGSSLLRRIQVSPDGRYACVTHNLARYQMPTTQLERGWMNTAALSIISLKELQLLNTVLLDDVDRGAANPWALGWSADGRWLCVTHAGTHEVSLIRFPELIAKLNNLPAKATPAPSPYETPLTISDVPNDLSFLVDLRQRLKLAGNGPRSLVVVSNQVWVADYFADALERIDLAAGKVAEPALPLQAAPEISEVRRGEMLFNDAWICFQQWQSCASCHSEDARVDGLNWDLLNDGIGNPKNTKSLLLAHETPPAMSTGVRETAETAVRAGIRHILFSVQPEAVALALDAWLKSLRAVPGPAAFAGDPSPAARRGQRLFQSARVGCAGCHPAPLWTNQRQYDVGTASTYDRAGEEFDTPSLVEVWRTGPYLHDGSAATLRDVLTTRNLCDRHGRISDLSPDQIDDLLQYLLSL